ncbi:hypothetical protein [Vreelandella maris]|uniref:Tyr recombinase domain-containing protein n=1 Tax=Vreelandella maris TaxID=2729617 RepID=A0A7Y6RGC6_9GAMM|nr:hypothetical protein [Halomonas maris]NVF16535.1 hypothetical protein [Halomonas maris]|tara:strand:- start:8690 stop:11086 length:2397 start_codon:yes stop_codon:yes gene_type:complete
MDESAKYHELLEEILQPRDDYFGIETIKPLLVQTLEQLIDIGDRCWNLSELSTLATAIHNDQLTLKSQSGRGEKGIHGTNPIHGALFKLSTAKEQPKKLNERLILLAHIINAAFKWRLDMRAAQDSQTFTEQREKRLKPATYLKSLEAACKVTRRIEADWIDFLTPLDQPTDKLCKRCDAYQVDEDSQKQDIYIKELGRFFAYALNIRQPRNGYQDKTDHHSQKKPPVQRKRLFDDDPDEHWEATAASVLALAPDISEETEGTLRTSGLSTAEERPAIELIQSDKPIKAAQGDSSLQAVFRARSQQIFQDKAAQLLPGRWEQLSTFDLYQLMQQLNQLNSGKRRRIGCVIGLLLTTGRNFEGVLNAQVLPSKRKIPSAIDEQSIVVVHGDSPGWVSGILRPENSRQMTGEWPTHMRVTQPRMTLPITPFNWQLIEEHSTHIARRVNKRALPLFNKDNREELENDVKALLSDANRKTGARLTVHRLGAHLFNTLNTGDADLTAACLITGRMPSFGQQASLYYYAPSTHRLAQPFLQAMRAIEQQCSAGAPEANDVKHTRTTAGPATGNPQHVGSKLVPKTAYVKELVATLQQRIKTANKSVQPLELFSMHNAYVAYTVAMLMFSTGYRSIRDPLPNWENISLPRRMIIIADKTDDEQSHARFLPLTSLMVEQLEHYQRHRKGILGRLDVYLQKAWNTPFMFLNQSGTPQEVTPSRLEVHLKWRDSPPLNINRHFLHTQLKESGLSSEIVDAFMGHWDAGQAPWASYSTFCPREYCELIAPGIEKLMKEQGWKALKGKAL